MFGRILEMQQDVYGPRDPRCFVTIDKINMIEGKGGQYEDAIEALHKTFTMPVASVSMNEITYDERSRSTKGSKGSKVQKWGKMNTIQLSKRSKPPKNKVIKVLNSFRKTKP
jgi:hypothetical protein